MSMQAWNLFLLLMAYPHMPYYATTANAQSDAMTLVSLSPPTTMASSTTAAAAAMTTTLTNTLASATTISYPSGTPLVNYQDSILVDYDTPWSLVKLSLLCQDGSQWAGYDANEIPSSGTYNLSPIGGSLLISKYPSLCHVHLEESGNSAHAIDGGNFVLASTKGPVEIFAASTTMMAATGVSGSATSAGSSTSSTSTGASGSTSSSSPSSTLDTAAGASSTTAASATASSAHSGLSGGTKAGIAFGVILIFALLLLAAFLYRRQRQRHSEQLQAVQSELANERAQRASEKAYLDSILNVAGKPDSEHGGKIRIADDVWQSGDWRRFFGSRAASAAGSVVGAAAAVGAAISNSRPGSRRASMARSRLGTAEMDEKQLPPIPAIPRKPVSAPSPIVTALPPSSTVTALPPSPTLTEGANTRGSQSEMGDTMSETGLIPPGSKRG